MPIMKALNEILLTNLDHKFDVIALSETWTSDSNQNILKSEKSLN